jgi:hypothetical protein
MHRSGTSALTRVLSLLGCDLPKVMIEANKTNEAGHWESTNIARLNDRILESGGSSWHDWLEFNPGWLLSPKAVEFREEALALLEEEFGTSRLFVLKDPRICRIAPFWLDVLEEAGIKPLIVSPLRNPLEVAASLERRNGFEPAYGHLLWLRHMVDAEFSSRGTPRIFASYDRLIKGWARFVADAETALGIAWPRFSDQAAAEIETFLSEKYRHHNEAVETVVENPTLSKWLRETYRILDNWSLSGEKPEDYFILDQVRTQFNSAAPAFARLITTGKMAVERTQGLEKSLAEAEARLRRVEIEARETVERLEGGLEAQTGVAEKAEKALTEARDRLAQTESALLQRRHEADEMATQAEKAKDEAQKAKAEADAAKAEKRELERRLAERFDETVAEAEKLKDEAQKAKAEADAAKAEKGKLERRLAERFDEIATLARLLRENEERTAKAGNQLGRAIAVLVNGRRWPTPLLRRLQMSRQVSRLKRSGLFDAEWYLAHNRDVAEAGMDPAWHYVAHGVKEARAPNAALAAARWGNMEKSSGDAYSREQP